MIVRVRTREERDEQTLDIMSAVLGAALLLAAPIVLVVIVVLVVGDTSDLERTGPVAYPVLVGAYFLTVAYLLRRR